MLLGTKLGRYEICRKIGVGGMGEVYLAHDSQLDRKVALKVLLPEFCCDTERVQRFKLEAKAASALNHPNIITIHEIDESNEQLFIATEYVDGETLREKIGKSELTLTGAIKIAEQVADALSVAHQAHIVHRDIKPENIMIRRDGYVKILDFGLAKPAHHQTSGAEDKTIQLVKTQPGIVMGSVQYMSPEQARGKEIDEKTDVWSLGVVLYEMLSGKNPFEGETISDSLAALIHVEPEPLTDAPEELHWIIRKALKKNAAERYQNIKDFAIDLRDLRLQIERGSGENNSAAHNKAFDFDKYGTSENKTLIHQTLPTASGTDGKRRFFFNATRSNTDQNIRKQRLIVPFVLLALMISIVSGVLWFRSFIFGSEQSVFRSPQVSRLTENGKSQLPAISSDGKYIAFVNADSGMQSLKVRQVATDSTVEIVPPMNLEFRQPAFSPDGNYIYYNLVDNGVGTVYRVPTLGGVPKKIVLDVDTKISFSPDEKQLVFARHNPNKGGDTVIIADIDGGNQQPLIDNKDAGFDMITEAVWSPDGSNILLGGLTRGGDGFENIKLAVISMSEKKIQFVGENSWIGASSFNWLQDGTGIVMIAKKEAEQSQQIWHVSYPEGAARQITNDTSDYSALSLASDGNTMITTKIDTISSFWSFVPGTRELKQITSESRNSPGYGGIVQSADGAIYYTKKNASEVNIWKTDENGGSEVQITAANKINIHPAVTKKGKYLVFSSNRENEFRIWRTDFDGKNPLQLSGNADGADFKPEISVDGQTVLFMRHRKNGGKVSILKVPIGGGVETNLLPDDNFSQLMPKISPDGNYLSYIAYRFDETNISLQNKLRIHEFSRGSLGETVKELPINVRKNYAWAPNGKAMIFINSDGTPNLWSYPLEGGEPKQITDFNSGKIVDFNWSNDGKKLFIVRSVSNSDLVLIKEVNQN